MSREQANTYRKFRTADDKQGNLGWAARMNRQGMKIAPEASPQIPSEFEFSHKEKAMWSLMKIGRRYNDLENSGVLEAEEVRAFLRGLVSADVLDIITHDECKSLLPLEVKRALGKKKKAAKTSSLKPRVYRPDIGLSTPPEAAEGPKKTAAPLPRSISGAFAAPPSTKVGLNREEKQRKKEIEADFEKMNEQDHYAFLGIPPKSDASAIKAAYMKRVRDLHPDNLSGSQLQDDAPFVEKADKLFKRLQTVNSVLSDEDARRKYDATLKTGDAHPNEGGKIRRPEEARLAYKKADVFFKKKDYQTAERHFKTAMDLDAEDPTFAIGYAWCVFLNERQPLDKRTTTAKERLRKIFDTSQSAEAAYKLGLIAAAAQDEKAATQWFERCLKQDPRHSEALQQKRVRDMRKRKAREEEEASKSVLGRFFKK